MTMPSTATHAQNINALKLLLQCTEPARIENLTAALLGQLLGVPIAVARTGFQHGADLGPAGRQGRRFRVECKKYRDGTPLNDRELLGEIDQALMRDEALEAWVLVATRAVPEQLELELLKKGESIGVPVIVIDWKPTSIPMLGALCASMPQAVEELLGTEAGELCRSIESAAATAVAQLRHEMQSWTLGFAALRTRSHERLNEVWQSPATSAATMGQNVSGGAERKRISRSAPNRALDSWWDTAADVSTPAVLLGWEGAGKTWAAIGWLVERIDRHPIVLLAPSSAVTDLLNASEAGVKQFIADRLYELGAVRDRTHWVRRLELLLRRPPSEGPVITLFLDGLNQEPSLPWLQLLKTLQAPPFAGKVRILLSTRLHYFNEKLGELRGLTFGPVLVHVEGYDTRAGGELDQMLELEGLTRADLQTDLIEMARTPRLFKLVVRFQERLLDVGQITIHRLLWEYGRDSFGTRAGRSFSENEWHEWLAEMAQAYRTGVRQFSTRELSQTTYRPDLTPTEVYARLSDIIDGRLAVASSSGRLQLTPPVVAHALAVALLWHLDDHERQTVDALNAELASWLDPITGLDQRADILRAAVSIIVERDRSIERPCSSAVVGAWLQTQNLPEEHRRELGNLAGSLTTPLLDTVERSQPAGYASARACAIDALRRVLLSRSDASATIIARTREWFSVVSRDAHTFGRAHGDYEKYRSQRFTTRVGVDASGPLKVLGIHLTLVDDDSGTLATSAVAIFDGTPLLPLTSAFETAAVATAVRGHHDAWDGLKWLCLLNSTDAAATATELRRLAASVLQRHSEPGIHPHLKERVAALLLWLTGFELDDEEANRINWDLERLTYKDYLQNPGSSFLSLERRHALDVLNDDSQAVFARTRRASLFFLDPVFAMPREFASALRDFASRIDMSQIGQHGGRTREGYIAEDIKPALARCSPESLFDLCRRKFQGFSTATVEARYSCADLALEDFLLAGPEEVGAVRLLREGTALSDSGDEAVVSSRLLSFEIQDVSAFEQYCTIVDADLKFIPVELGSILKALTCDEADALLERYVTRPAKQHGDLLVLISIHSTCLNERVWAWVEATAYDANASHRAVAFKTLCRADARRFGYALLQRDWSWTSDSNSFWINDYGSSALIEATLSTPFDQIASRIAPWRVLEAARRRGSDPAEVRLAAEIVGRALEAKAVGEPDLGASLTLNCVVGREHPRKYRVDPNESEDDAQLARRLSAAFDVEGQREARRRAWDVASARIDQAKRDGADLFLESIPPDDLAPVILHHPRLIDRWLDGASALSVDFVRRVRLAEFVYLSICEALLVADPEKGASLWYALRLAIKNRLRGYAGVDELVHLAFRAQDCPPVESMRLQLLSLQHCNTDLALFDLAIAATSNGKGRWLEERIAEDLRSSVPWKEKRALVLSGFTSGNELPTADAWPAGETVSSFAHLRREAFRGRFLEAVSCHWWREYCAAEDPNSAYAAWVLYLASVDRRSSLQLEKLESSTAAVSRRALLHVALNRSKVERSAERQLNNLDRKFLGRDVVTFIAPWRDRHV